MQIDILTIFPELFDSPLQHGIIRRAQQHQIVQITAHNLRDFTHDRHQIVDDRPFGGGEGMVLKPEPIFRAVEYLTNKVAPQDRAVVMLTPQGQPFKQQLAQRLSQLKQLIMICGRYEGVDERVNNQHVTEQISIGDFVLSGGEFAALVIVDAIVRLLPKALGCADSTENESFSSGLLDCPVYTRPAEYRGLSVPQILLSGDHAKIARWRREQALLKTAQYRPDLLVTAALSAADRQFLSTISDQPAASHQSLEKKY